MRSSNFIDYVLGCWNRKEIWHLERASNLLAGAQVVDSDEENFMKGTEIGCQLLCDTHLRKQKVSDKTADNKSIMDAKIH